MPLVPISDPTPALTKSTSGKSSHLVPISGVIGELPGAVAETTAGLLARQAESALGTLKRNAAPVALQGAGQTAGELAGALLAPDTGGASLLLPLLLGAAGAGAGNVAASKLPKEYGGTPGESKLRSFMWGAIPGAIGGATTKILGRGLGNAAKAAGEEANAEFGKAAEKQAADHLHTLVETIKGEPVTQGHVNQLAKLLGGQIGGEPLEGAARTAATNDATSAILGPINRMRQKVGAPLGEAYEKLKGTDQRISEEQASDIAEAAQRVRGDLISPSPKAAGVFQKLKSFAPRAEADAPGKLVSGPGGQLLVSPQDQMRGLSAGQVGFLQKAEQAKGSPLTFRETQAALAQMPAEDYKPPTLDELREARQQVDASLRNAKGGDIHALLGYRGTLDKVLSQHLPDNMSDLRNSYAGFIKNYEWRDINKLRAAGSPAEAAQWLFSRDPSVVNEIIGKATPEERGTIRNLFGDHVLSGVDPDASVAEQTKAIQKNLRGPSANGTLNRLYGPEVQEAKNNLIHLPARRAALAKYASSPAGKKIYTDAFVEQAQKSGRTGQQAALAAFNKVASKLSPEDQKFLSEIVQPSPEGAVTEMPTSRDLMKRALVQKRQKQMLSNFLKYEVAGSALTGAAGIAGGGSSFWIRYGLGWLFVLGTTQGYRAVLDMGGADLIAKMYAKPVGRAAGAAAFRTLALIGGRIAHQVTQPQGANNAANP
jgi:hypothetical protein